MQIHGYPYDATGSTFIGSERRACGSRPALRRLRTDSGLPVSPTRSRSPGSASSSPTSSKVTRCMANNSRWISFTTVRNEAPGCTTTWSILGDAAHTAHFSIGSGTKLAMEDALALARCIYEERDLGAALHDVRGGAQGRRALDPTCGTGQPRVVREPPSVRRPGAAAVRVQRDDPKPTGDLRQPAGTRSRVRGPLRGMVRAAGRRRRGTAPATYVRRCSSRFASRPVTAPGSSW